MSSSRQALSALVPSLSDKVRRKAAGLYVVSQADPHFPYSSSRLTRTSGKLRRLFVRSLKLTIL